MGWLHENSEILAAVLLTFATLIHLIRILAGWALQLGPYSIPSWASWIAVIIAGYLAYHFWSRTLEE